LYHHLEWADARVWRAALGSPAAVGDAELRDRLRHIHVTQRAFLDVWTTQPVGKYLDAEFPSLPNLYAWARPYYARLEVYLATLADTDLATPMPIPWARRFSDRGGGGAPAVTTLGETLFQVTSHSTYHRGQVNTRLRALGVDPPLVDYIAWVWQRRPQPVWLGLRPSDPRSDGT
jgi:uncharacterized damage-inducible protein DinB